MLDHYVKKSPQHCPFKEINFSQWKNSINFLSPCKYLEIANKSILNNNTLQKYLIFFSPLKRKKNEIKCRKNFFTSITSLLRERIFSFSPSHSNWHKDFIFYIAWNVKWGVVVVLYGWGHKNLSEASDTFPR